MIGLSRFRVAAEGNEKVAVSYKRSVVGSVIGECPYRCCGRPVTAKEWQTARKRLRRVGEREWKREWRDEC